MPSRPSAPSWRRTNTPTRKTRTSTWRRTSSGCRKRRAGPISRPTPSGPTHRQAASTTPCARSRRSRNAKLKGALPKGYARPALNKVMLGELIDLFSDIGMHEEVDKAPRPDRPGLRILPRRVRLVRGQARRRVLHAPLGRPTRWSRCWSPTRAASTTPAAAPAACSCSPRNSSRSTAGRLDDIADLRPGDATTPPCASPR